MVNKNVKLFWQHQWDDRPIKVIKDAALFSAHLSPQHPLSIYYFKEHWETVFAREEEGRNETLKTD